jgi:uncharacterized cupredoxin-like copper-binding protein
MTPPAALALSLLLAACDLGRGETNVYIAAQDFRFSPNEIRLLSGRPVRLVIRNEGREPHQVGGALLAHAEPEASAALQGPAPSTPDPSGTTLAPGQSLHIRLTPGPGTYELRCQIKGHTGMRATVIVEG